jgi:hypothetical protein
VNSRKKPEQLPASRILELILSGEIVVRFKRGYIEVKKGKRVLTSSPDRKNKYTLVRICKDGMRRGIALHRIGWMAYHKKLVPADHHLHHIKGRSHNHPRDLELLHYKVHQRLEGRKGKAEDILGYPPDWDVLEEPKDFD